MVTMVNVKANEWKQNISYIGDQSKQATSTMIRSIPTLDKIHENVIKLLL